MKKIITLFVLCHIGINGFSQAPVIEWQKCLGGTAWDTANSIQLTPDGGYIMTGFTFSNNGDVTGNHGQHDVWVLKIDTTGAIEWKKTFGGTSDDYGNYIQHTAEGGYIMACTARSINGDVTGNHGSEDVWIVKLSATGALEWQKTLGGTSVDSASTIQLTPDGGYIVAGGTFSNNGDVTGNHGSYDAWVVKLDAIGALEWQKCLGGTDSDVANSIQPSSDGGYIMAGYTFSNNGNVTGNHGGQDAWVVKLSTTGAIEWQKCLGGTNDEDARSIQLTTDDGYILAGMTASNNGNVTGNHGGNDAWIVKLSATGAVVWQKCLGGTSGESADSIQTTSDGDYIVAGDTFSNNGNVTGNHGSQDAWVVKLTPTGSQEWQKCLGGTSDDGASCILSSADGGYIVVGSTQSNNGDVSGNHGGGDFWVVKLGSALSTSTFNKQALLLYPNPTTGKLFLEVGDLQNYTIEIFDIIGKKVSQFENQSTLDISNFNQGVYIMKVLDGQNVLKTQKIIKQ